MSATETLPPLANSLPSLSVNSKRQYGDWRDDFFRNGYYIFKQAVPQEKVQTYYYRKALDWLQSFDNGLDLNNKDTWKNENLPKNIKNMYMNYCAAHEKFVWDARTEPKVIEPFAQIWGTEELLVSFDGFNVTLPGRKDDEYRPWPHIDQAPERKGFACVQGLLNLAPAGPKDGGLILMHGSSALFEEYFETCGMRPRKEGGAKHLDSYMFELEDLKWFESKGCYEFKVDCDPGDLILWDSRTIHHVAKVESDIIRSVIYICMAPAALAEPDELAFKTELFKKYDATTHWPHCNIWSQGKAMIDGKVDPLERDEPLEKPVETDQVLRLAGVIPY